MAKDKQEQSAEQSATTVKAESAPAQTPAPATETNDGFQADRDSWGEAMAKVHLVLLAASMDLGAKALDILLRVKSALDAAQKKSQPGITKSPWTSEDFTKQCGLLDSAARVRRPDLTSDRSISAAYHVRAYVLAKALLSILGDGVMALSHNFMANYLCGWLLDFSTVDLETMAREASNPKEAPNRIKAEWMPWIKSHLANYLTDPKYTQASLIASAKEFKAELDKAKLLKKGVDPALAELESQRKKQEAERSALVKAVDNTIAKALTGKVLTPQEVIQAVPKIATALKLDIPAGSLGGFDPAKASPQECAIMLATMDRTGNHAAIRFLAKASARMVAKLDSADMTDLLSESAQEPTPAPALKIASA